MADSGGDDGAAEGRHRALRGVRHRRSGRIARSVARLRAVYGARRATASYEDEEPSAGRI
ncbi:hypothetical protein [Streptomyces sp. NPDC003077]|uniref:hypothetical protein n=1 Tax=Streptomyces sp. NPDC003077 TaxID=3154443 RepID=UPI0033B1AF69